MAEDPLLPATYDIVWSGVVLLLVALLVWTLVSIARSGLTPSAKFAWVIIVVLLPLIGPICWLVARPKNLHGYRRPVRRRVPLVQGLARISTRRRLDSCRSPLNETAESSTRA